jgi:hypothetical protein
MGSVQVFGEGACGGVGLGCAGELRIYSDAPVIKQPLWDVEPISIALAPGGAIAGPASRAASHKAFDLGMSQDDTPPSYSADGNILRLA